MTHYPNAVLLIFYCICPTRRPIVVTCGSDKTIRIWNYNDRKLLLCKDIEDEPMCITGRSPLPPYYDTYPYTNIYP